MLFITKKEQFSTWGMGRDGGVTIVNAMPLEQYISLLLQM